MRDVHLTARDRQVVYLLARGCSYKAVARALGVSTRTVEGYARLIAARLPDEVQHLGAQKAIMIWATAAEFLARYPDLVALPEATPAEAPA